MHTYRDILCYICEEKHPNAEAWGFVGSFCDDEGEWHETSWHEDRRRCSTTLHQMVSRYRNASEPAFADLEETARHAVSERNAMPHQAAIIRADRQATEERRRAALKRINDLERMIRRAA